MEKRRNKRQSLERNGTEKIDISSVFEELSSSLSLLASSEVDRRIVCDGFHVVEKNKKFLYFGKEKMFPFRKNNYHKRGDLRL